MNAAELAEATKQFDEPLVLDRSRPLTPAEKEQWKRIRKKKATRKQRKAQ